MIAFTCAILAALLSSYYLSALHSRQLLILFYHLPFRFWRPYTLLYDGLESTYTYELLGGKQRFKSHTAFLNDYRKLRLHVAERFRGLWSLYARRTGRDYGLVFLVALGLFWSVWWLFAFTFLVVQAVALLYMRYVNKCDIDLAVSAVVSLLLHDEQTHVK